MLRVKSPFMASSLESDSEVFVSKGDMISEITDAGPENFYQGTLQGWNVTFRLTPAHKLWSEVAMCDAVELLKALEGNE